MGIKDYIDTLQREIEMYKLTLSRISKIANCKAEYIPDHRKLNNIRKELEYVQNRTFKNK